MTKQQMETKKTEMQNSIDSIEDKVKEKQALVQKTKAEVSTLLIELDRLKKNSNYLDELIKE